MKRSLFDDKHYLSHLFVAPFVLPGCELFYGNESAMKQKQCVDNIPFCVYFSQYYQFICFYYFKDKCTSREIIIA